MFEIVATSVTCLSLRIISLFFSTFLLLLTLDFNDCTAFTTFFWMCVKVCQFTLMSLSNSLLPDGTKGRRRKKDIRISWSKYLLAFSRVLSAFSRFYYDFYDLTTLYLHLERLLSCHHASTGLLPASWSQASESLCHLRTLHTKLSLDLSSVIVLQGDKGRLSSRQQCGLNSENTFSYLAKATAYQSFTSQPKPQSHCNGKQKASTWLTFPMWPVDNMNFSSFIYLFQMYYQSLPEIHCRLQHPRD